MSGAIDLCFTSLPNKNARGLLGPEAFKLSKIDCLYLGDIIKVLDPSLSLATYLTPELHGQTPVFARGQTQFC
jgi:hypothetical protein